MKNQNSPRNIRVNLILATLSIITLMGCEKKPLTASQLVELTLDYHDPSRVFPTSTIAVDQLTKMESTPDDAPRTTRITLDNTQGSIETIQEFDGFSLVRSFDGNTFTYQHNAPVDSLQTFEPAPNEKERMRMLRSYYRYMIGLPHALQDDEAIIQPQVKDTVYNGVALKEILILYEPIDTEPKWYFFINPNTGEMVQTRFVRTDGAGKESGEIINYGPYIDYKGMKMTSKLEWLYLDSKPLAIEDLTYLD